MIEMICRCTVLLFLGVASICPVWAQVTKLTSPDQFSEDAFPLTFHELGGGHDASGAYASLGIFFQGESSSRPMTRAVIILPVLPPDVDIAIENDGAAQEALIIPFQKPQRRVGFTLGNGSQDTVAVLSALTGKGELLGSIEQESIEELRGPFVGVETADPEGISTIILDRSYPES